MNDFWHYTLLNNTLRDWAICLIIIIVSLTVLRLIKAIAINRLRAYALKTKTTIDDFIIAAIQSSVMPLLSILAVYYSLHYIKIQEQAGKILHIAVMVAVTFYSIRIIVSFIRYCFTQALSKQQEDGQREKQANGILLIVQIIIWILGILFLINNLGYNITTLIAGLGIGGIAIALAAQTILGDLFSYLVIFFDKPFEIGDFIVVQDKMGTVEYIGIKTTRLRALSGEQLVCSNTDLTNSRVHNYKRMQERRIVFTFGVVYKTPAEKLKSIPPLVKRIIEEQSDTRFDRAHFLSFGSFSLNFEVVYYVLSPDFNAYMDKQQMINLNIFEAFEKEQIEFALPTQMVTLNKEKQEENTPDLNNTRP